MNPHISIYNKIVKSACRGTGASIGCARTDPLPIFATKFALIGAQPAKRHVRSRHASACNVLRGNTKFSERAPIGLRRSKNQKAEQVPPTHTRSPGVLAGRIRAGALRSGTFAALVCGRGSAEANTRRIISSSTERALPPLAGGFWAGEHWSITAPLCAEQLNHAGDN